MNKLKLTFFLLIVLTACNSGNEESKEQPSSDNSSAIIPSHQSGLAIPNNQVVDHYQILLMGNSHVRGIGTLISSFIKTRFPEKSVTSSNAPGIAYLSERVNDKASIDMLINTPWTHVILQAQKYSSSGDYNYPTDAAVTLINLAKNQNSTPILFPEHPRENNTIEGSTVYLLHKGITTAEPACVAPVGLAWDRAIELHPELSLHHPDGNHANSTGRFLTALVFYQIITGEPADTLPYIPEVDVNELTQDKLGQIASYILEQHQACHD
ncbi:MAG: hypothetical protein OQK09_08345 [Colwellia sp.]|nr:hypothetical protein [Colwellia sp.]MCW9081509.1 hypothetical protein [Colwellia sp.]